MKSQFKSNNFIAIIIALMLFAAGFLLLFIHQRSESSQTRERVKTTSLSPIAPVDGFETALPTLPVDAYL